MSNCLFSQQQAIQFMLSNETDIARMQDILKKNGIDIGQIQNRTSNNTGYERESFGRPIHDSSLLYPFYLKEGGYSIEAENYYKRPSFTIDGVKTIINDPADRTKDTPNPNYGKFTLYEHNQWEGDNYLLFVKDGPVHKALIGGLTVPNPLDNTKSDHALIIKAIEALNNLANNPIKAKTDGTDAAAQFKKFAEANWIIRNNSDGNILQPGVAHIAANHTIEWAKFTHPRTGKDLFEAALVGNGRGGNALDWQYTYVFPNDVMGVNPTPNDPMSYQNWGSDSVLEYLISPLRNKQKEPSGISAEERSALTAYWEYYKLLYTGNGSREIPTNLFSKSHIVAGKVNHFYGDRATSSDAHTAARSKYDAEGQRFDPEGMFNMMRSKLGYEKIRIIMRRFKITQRVAYLYFCTFSLTRLFKMIATQQDMKEVERNAWKKFILSKVQLIQQFLDDKRNWPAKEIDKANRTGLGPYLSSVWLDIYACLKFIEQSLNRSKKTIDFVAQAPSEQVLQTLNEYHEEYDAYMRDNGMQLADPMSMWEMCSTKGIQIELYNKDTMTQIVKPFTDVNGKKVLTREVEQLLNQGKLHVECVGLLAVYADQLNEGVSVGVTPKPALHLLNPKVINNLLKVGMPAAYPVVQQGTQIYSLPLDKFRKMIHKEALENEDYTTADIFDEDAEGGFLEESEEDSDGPGMSETRKKIYDYRGNDMLKLASSTSDKYLSQKEKDYVRKNLRPQIPVAKYNRLKRQENTR